MTETRINAMVWWRHDLSFDEKETITKENFKNRTPQSLTGREIEILWKLNQYK